MAPSLSAKMHEYSLSEIIISPLAGGWSYDAWVFARAIMLQ